MQYLQEFREASWNEIYEMVLDDDNEWFCEMNDQQN